MWATRNELTPPGIYKIVASSGSGKSTLISFFGGLRGDYSGDVFYNEKRLSDFKAKDWGLYRRQEASFVYQDLRLFPDLTERENIELSQALSGSNRNSYSNNLQEFATKLGIGDKLNKKIRLLSFGQMQRVAILRAILRNYKWLILDEPFSHLDLENASMAWNLIVECAKERQAGIIIACLDPYPFIQANKQFYL